MASSIMASSPEAEAKLAKLKATAAELEAAEEAAEADLKAAVMKLKETEAELEAAVEAKMKASLAEAEAKWKAAETEVHHFNGFQCIPFEEILEYHRKRLKYPELSVEQLCHIFGNQTKLLGTEKLIEIYENKKDLDETSKSQLIKLKARFAEETKRNKRLREEEEDDDDRPLKR